MPVLFALFLALLLSPAVELLARHRVPRVVAATLVMAVLLALVGRRLSATWKPARAWLDTAPATLRKLERKLRPVTRFIAKVESVSTQAGRMTEPDPATQEEPTPGRPRAEGVRREHAGMGHRDRQHVVPDAVPAGDGPAARSGARSAGLAVGRRRLGRSCGCVPNSAAISAPSH